MTSIHKIDNIAFDINGGLPVDVKYPLPDLGYLKEMADGDKTFMREIITIFLETCPSLLISMTESALAGDYDELRFAAHTLLPQLTFVGILGAIDDVTKIERDSKHLDNLIVILERSIKVINYGMEDLKKMVLLL